MSDAMLNAVIILIAVFLIAALLLRWASVTNFEQKKRAKAFVQYAVDTMKKQPTLNNDHGFFIDPKLSKLTADEFKVSLPNAIVTHEHDRIVIKLPNTKWVIPVCTTEEYTELYV
jgi:hypothetical protein